jgi:hypothetical protein
MGHNVVLRFRLATDCGVGGPGWYVDSIQIAYFNDVHPTPTPTATATASAPSSPTPTATATATVAPTATPAAQAINLSTRMRVQTGDNVGIGGFIITGNAPKQVLLRGIGPSLASAGIPTPLADPVMELHGPAGFTTIVNDNWRDDTLSGPIIQATGLGPTNDLESAILVTLNPGAYTAILKGKNNTTGVALVEVYDLAQPVASKLANISTRAFVGTGGDIMIAGFILANNSNNDNVILLGNGPSLTQFGVPNVLADPKLELRDSNGVLIIMNDNWQDNPACVAAGVALRNPLESCIAVTLAPSQYTALLYGVNNGTGVGLIEVYDRGGP